jgi:hypothetical protein
MLKSAFFDVTYYSKSIKKFFKFFNFPLQLPALLIEIPAFYI